MGLAYTKEPGGFLITLDNQPIGRLRWLRAAGSDGSRYTPSGCAIVGIPWFVARTYPTAWAARMALADALVEEQILEATARASEEYSE